MNLIQYSSFNIYDFYFMLIIAHFIIYHQTLHILLEVKNQ